MKVPRLNDSVSEAAALDALRAYREHRSKYDARDWEVEKIYRQISKGKVVISVAAAISAAGVGEDGRPKLAIARADCETVRLAHHTQERAGFNDIKWGRRWNLTFPCPGIRASGQALMPRIPPMHRPAAEKLKEYWVLWEADWKALPRDPFLLRRLATDAWVVLAAWDLTEVELSVLRARPEDTRG